LFVFINERTLRSTTQPPHGGPHQDAALQHLSSSAHLHKIFAGVLMISNVMPFAAVSALWKLLADKAELSVSCQKWV